ncbi:hypothetical protein [Achromobacter sp. NFACC18-2]|uniref:hypothetical protein n=1 Tax=Achromobacter sp. NFACC18-2 TaxID=1564112 RepID=UPI0011140209|nr:hypothetical protein [Achromobacter sp. NFACC18-2]
MAKLASVARALAVLEWDPQRGYMDMQNWASVGELARADLLAINVMQLGEGNFAGILRGLGAIVSPAALCVSGVSRAVFKRTLAEAGIDGLMHQAAAPMTLDGALRVDGLVGFRWPGNNPTQV